MEKTLRALGITRRYKGYRQLVYAMTLVPKPTMQIYKETAQHFGCSWRAVEQNIRMAAARAWEVNPALLSEMAGCPLDSAPTTGRFIKMVAQQTLHSDNSEGKAELLLTIPGRGI